MPKPPTKKRSPSEVAEEKALAAEVMLRKAALAYAAVAKLDPSDPRWRRCWRALHLAASGMAAATQEATEPAGGHLPSRALASRRSANPLRRVRRAAWRQSFEHSFNFGLHGTEVGATQEL